MRSNKLDAIGPFAKASCDETKKLIVRAGGLTSREKQRIYSQVHDQPCP